VTREEATSIVESLVYQRENNAVVTLHLNDCKALRKLLEPSPSPIPQVERVRRIMDAGEPFARAASMGQLAYSAVRKADMSAVTTLVGISSQCAVHVAESNISWADWSRLLEAWNCGGES
jgi:hypothetical protein